MCSALHVLGFGLVFDDSGLCLDQTFAWFLLASLLTKLSVKQKTNFRLYKTDIFLV